MVSSPALVHDEGRRKRVVEVMPLGVVASNYRGWAGNIRMAAAGWHKPRTGDACARNNRRSAFTTTIRSVRIKGEKKN